MASDAADALAKTYARNKKLLSLRSITNGLQQTGVLFAYTHSASVHLDPPHDAIDPKQSQAESAFAYRDLYAVACRC